VTASVVQATTAAARPRSGLSPAAAVLAATVLAFFVVTLDATVVSVALPSIRDDLGGGLTGLQRLVDGYRLMFAALLLSARALVDRLRARTALGTGIGMFGALLATGGFVLVAAAATPLTTNHTHQSGREQA
jgi:MFS transporter, DHA2 family, methylenomycin A resistance protein